MNWQPAYTIKAYPELQGYFSRAENHLLAYLHNWSSQLCQKGHDGEWIFLTQEQISQQITYSASSVRRLIKQINSKCQLAVIEIRSRQIWLTRFFNYQVFEYRIDWEKVLNFISTNKLEMAETAQSSHRHFNQGGDYAEQGVAQNSCTYKDPFKDPIKEIKNSPTPLFAWLGLIAQEESQNMDQEFNQNADAAEQQTRLALNKSNTVDCSKTIKSEDVSSAPLKKMNLPHRSAVALGLIQQNKADGSKSYVPNPAGHSRGRSVWIDQGIGLGLWQTREQAIAFQGAVAQYARNQEWCKSALDYSNSVIRGLIAGDNPKADRYWEAWRNNQPIGWENLFDWEVQPGVVNPAFANWVTTQLFDSTKSAAANTATAAKEIKFNARPLWERYQREVAREMQTAQQAQQRGQTYLPPGALLPRIDQPSVQDTEQQVGWLMQQQVEQLSLAPITEPEITAQEFGLIDPTKADILNRIERICGVKTGIVQVQQPVELDHPSADSQPNWAVNPSVTTTPLKLPPPPLPPKPLATLLLPEVNHQRKLLELEWRRKTAPYDIAKAAKFLVWAKKGNAEMQQEAIAWLLANNLHN
jgi:hypothetical protein